MENPSHFLQNALNRTVLIRLKDSRILRGRLSGFDEHLNLVLEGTQETTGELSRHLGLVVVRGNQVVSVVAPDLGGKGTT
jgi:small nuclear ribonucleoprotein